MEIVWEDPPVHEGPFFTRDLYDRCSLAPTIRELWAFLQSPTENADMKQEHETEALKAACLQSTDGATEYKDEGCISKEESCWDSYDSDDLRTDSGAERIEDFKDKKSKGKQKRVPNEPDIVYPEPRVPFPCMSTLTCRDQKTYLDILLSKNRRDPPQNLMERVKNEVMQFMRYLQDVSKMCADDYNVLPHGASQYSEEFFRGCLEYIKTLPQIYQIYELTSLTGGTFNVGLTLTFEKQLLMMGNVDVTDHTIVPADAQLASDYHSVSSETLPAKKAKDIYATISCDSNAEKLCSHYQPHICLTQQALLRLLDNHGPEFGQQWELPVWVKLNPVKASSHKKTVYVDSPLLKTEVTIRERNHIYHEESFKTSVKKNGSKHVFHLMTELPLTEQQLPPDTSQRNVDDDGLDFAVDLTDLETFGETKVTKSPMMLKNVQVSCHKGQKVIPSPPTSKTLSRNVHRINTSSSLQEKMNTLVTDVDGPITDERTHPAVSEIGIPKSDQLRDVSCQESEEDATLAGESDDDKLVIDDEKSPAKASSPQSKPESPLHSVDSIVITTSETFSDTPAVSETGTPKNDQLRNLSCQKSEEGTVLTGESDDDKLAGDQQSPAQTPSVHSKPETPQCSVDTLVAPNPVNLKSPSSQKGTSQRRGSRRAKVSDDQLGEILRMQTAMFNPAKDDKRTIKSQEAVSQCPSVRQAVHSHPTSLVKPCVSSYLESSQNCPVSPRRPAPVVSSRAKEQKKILSQDLQAGTEDEQDYKAPDEGNLFYKLYSLEDLLLMVRSSVSLTHTRRLGNSQNQHVPVHVLPKLEYQLTYGVECISSSEACQLWTEALLHSSTVSYIAHINAHTSKVALLRKLPDDWKQNISCGFKPAKSLNILHHLLKKLTKLDEGRYLIAHKAREPFVTILKAVNGKGNRGEYSLQQVHSSLPQPPTSSLVPWLPVDPDVVLPFHQKYGRVPCTFPPRSFMKAKDSSSQHHDHGANQAKTDVNAEGNVKTKKKKAKRKAHRNKYIKKLIKDSI
ncbi:little elongation complex subunit 2 isoform X2 [Thalassophryne amazonica]|uniref:little elongation complex subunit 2 isoform X2 n=1 Tax=Thalassophryne amazonica TaxID=390379 RepID=UPI001471C570|nr:little elongation complex subunit 2 isoform X2 [Thalassophryne amazonica]